jgi:hypothetical protein
VLLCVRGGGQCTAVATGERRLLMSLVKDQPAIYQDIVMENGFITTNLREMDIYSAAAMWEDAKVCTVSGVLAIAGAPSSDLFIPREDY